MAWDLQNSQMFLSLGPSCHFGESNSPHELEETMFLSMHRLVNLTSEVHTEADTRLYNTEIVNSCLLLQPGIPAAIYSMAY